MEAEPDTCNECEEKSTDLTELGRGRNLCRKCFREVTADQEFLKEEPQRIGSVPDAWMRSGE